MPFRKTSFWISVSLILALLVLWSACWVLYSSFRNQLEQELGERLIATATSTAALINDQTWLELLARDPVSTENLRRTLQTLSDQNSLSDIFLFDSGRYTLLDGTGQYPEGEINPVLQFDRDAVDLAMGGTPSSSALYESGGDYLKSGYAAVVDSLGRTVGGIGAESSALFFGALSGIRTTLFGTAGLASAVLLLLSALWYRILSRQERLQQDLQRSETLATLGQMAAIVAHEVRNPLGIIRGSAETLAKRYGLEDDPIYQFIPSEVDRLHQTVSAYLDFSHQGSEESVDLGEALDQSLTMMRYALERKGIRLVTEIQKGSFQAGAGGRLWQQAFLNLILNAEQAMSGGGTLHVGLQRRKGTATVTFRDSGAGMSSEVRSRALDPFFTDKEKGSGLGLAIVSRTVRETKGSIHIESTEGKGTTIVLTVPLTAESGHTA